MQHRLTRFLWIFAVALAMGCGDAVHRDWGEPVDPAAAVSLAELLSAEAAAPAREVTLSGRIGEVCRSAGCWFVLQDTMNGKFFEVLVDLKPAASFTVPADLQGHDAFVRGRLVGTPPDLQLNAVGLRVE